MSPGVNLEKGEQPQRRQVSVRATIKNYNIAYLNAGTRNLVPIVSGGVPSVNILGGVAAPDGIINAGSSPDGGTREVLPAVVVVVPLVNRLD